MEWQLIDKRETRYIFARIEDYETDLNMIRRRYVDLKDAPRLEDSYRFPDRNTATDLLSFNRAYRRWLEGQLALNQDRPWIITIPLKETDELYKVWDAVRDAGCDYYYITVRRQALLKVKELVGDESYYRGVLPPYVPIWRFRDE